MDLNSLISRFYHSNFFSRIFHTTVYCLQRELENCESVLDVGCGPNSPLQYCQNIKYSVGVEPFKPYLEKSKERRIHTKYLNKKIEELSFPEKSFDAVVMVEVLEHLDKKTAIDVLREAGKWAKKKIIITTPNGYIEQLKLDKNPYQVHKSGWAVKELEKFGFRYRGLAGLKILRRTKEDSDSMDDNLLVSIKFQPKIFWFVLAALSQIVTYYFPSIAFELFCVKNYHENEN